MEEVKVKLENHEQRILTIESKVTNLEQTQKEIQALTISVHDLAKAVADMVNQQKEHSDRIKALENVPLESMNATKRTFITSIISAFGGAVAALIINFISQL